MYVHSLLNLYSFFPSFLVSLLLLLSPSLTLSLHPSISFHHSLLLFLQSFLLFLSHLSLLPLLFFPPFFPPRPPPPPLISPFSPPSPNLPLWIQPKFLCWCQCRLSLTVHLPEHNYIVLGNRNTLVKTTEGENFFNGLPTLSGRSKLQPGSPVAVKYVKEIMHTHSQDKSTTRSAS